MSVLIVEGVTGAGKTSTIKALGSIVPFRLFDESATFNDFMSEFADNPDTGSERARDRMSAILDEIEARSAARYVLERFYFSQLAVGSEWKWYRDLNRRCELLKITVAVLTIPEDEIPNRALYRAEFGGIDWQHVIEHYGSERRAIDVICAAQTERLKAVDESGLAYRIFCTAERAWERHAVEIAQWASWPIHVTSQRPL